MENNLFRKKSIDKISSPEQLSDYLHVTNPGVWIVLTAVMLFLLGILIWSNFASIESYAYGTAEIDKGIVRATFSDMKTAENVVQGMNLTIGEIVIPIESLGKDNEGNIMAVAYAELPDGIYEIKVGYKQTQIITMLFN